SPRALRSSPPRKSPAPPATRRGGAMFPVGEAVALRTARRRSPGARAGATLRLARRGLTATHGTARSSRATAAPPKAAAPALRSASGRRGAQARPAARKRQLARFVIILAANV